MHGRLSDSGSHQVRSISSPTRRGTPSRCAAGCGNWSRCAPASSPSRYEPSQQGTYSVGVKRQYRGALGKIANCQVPVSTVLLSDRLAWPLSSSCTSPRGVDYRCGAAIKAGIPEPVRLREKWCIGLRHIRRVLQAGFQLTASSWPTPITARRAYSAAGSSGSGCATAWRSGRTIEQGPSAYPAEVVPSVRIEVRDHRVTAHPRPSCSLL